VALLSRSDFADLAHVSKPAVTKAVGSGRIVVNADGMVDTENPKNALYLDAQKHKAKKTEIVAAGKKKKPRAKGDTVSPPSDDQDDEYELANEAIGLDAKKKQADINLKRSQNERHQLAIAEKKGELIPRDLVRRKFSAFDAAMKTHLRDMPRRSAARLHAIAVSEGPRALETALEKEISEGLARVKEAAKEGGLGEA